MTTFTKTLLLVGASLLLSSCAMTNKRLVVGTIPQLTFYDDSPITKTILIDKVKDIRGLPDDKAIFMKKNLYNQTTKGKYIAQESIANLVTTLIEKAFQKRNITLKKNDYEIQLLTQLIAIDYTVIQGWVSSEVITKTTIKFTLVDEQNNLLWSDIIIGTSKNKASNIKEYLPQTLDNVLDQLLNRSDFIKHLK